MGFISIFYTISTHRASGPISSIIEHHQHGRHGFIACRLKGIATSFTAMNTLPHASLSIRLPNWLMQMTMDTHYPSIESRMQLAIQLAKYNIEHATGGPFGAAVFDMHSQQLIAVGVNVVVSSACSMAHAEMMAISMAQQAQGDFNLAAAGSHLELVSSCEPCAMCFGAIPWSGIKQLCCGARDADARAIGFDEGPKMDHWQQALEQRGIAVQTDICRHDAIDVLQHYASHGGAIYNAGNKL
jgi:tRNA(Arg) A34 adenosine deaminase TadA